MVIKNTKQSIKWLKILQIVCNKKKATYVKLWIRLNQDVKPNLLNPFEISANCNP